MMHSPVQCITREQEKVLLPRSRFNPDTLVFLCSSFKTFYVTFVDEYSVDCNMCEISTVVCPTTISSHPLTPLWNDGINQMIPRFFSLRVLSALWGRQVKKHRIRDAAPVSGNISCAGNISAIVMISLLSKTELQHRFSSLILENPLPCIFYSFPALS